MSKKADIIIVGGGMVGLSLAALVGKAFSVIVIDNQPSPNNKKKEKQYANRVSAISRSSETILKKVHAWKFIEDDKKTAYRSMKIWDANTSANLTFSAQALSEPNLGYIIENDSITSGLYTSLLSLSNVQVLSNVSWENLNTEESNVSIDIENGQGTKERLYAKLVIGADGAQSKVRQACQFDIEQKQYHQKALVTQVRTEKPHQFTAWQRFLPTGPIAFLPLSDPYTCSIVWSLLDDSVETLLAKTEKEHNQLIAQALDYQLGEVLCEKKLMGFPLIAKHAGSYLKPGVALIGDAAHTVHPLAGQGVNLGFLDALALSTQLLDAKQKGFHWYKKGYLRPFERQRKHHNHIIQKSMTVLNKMFSLQDPFSILTRSAGIQWMNEQNWIKIFFMQQAMGLHFHQSIQDMIYE